jgi:SHAQKYF class myb-like DNA-binding protein
LYETIFFCLVTGESWSEEEHKNFLLGLKNLGKGDWRGISRNYVGSRTPTQVASHAQKYFIRQTNNNRRKRRSSLFDMVIDDVSISPYLFMFTASSTCCDQVKPLALT